MSGAGSSSGAGKKRGPAPAQRGDPAENVQSEDFGRRWITYRDAGVPHRQSTRLRDSPLLRFTKGSDEHTRLKNLHYVELLPYRRIDWGLVDVLGQRGRLEQILGEKFRRVLDCDALQYKELTLEFHSTFEYKQGSFDETDAVSFALGRRTYEMSIPQFAVATQFYTQDEVSSATFRTSLRGIFTKKYKHSVQRDELIRFWGTISLAPYSNNMVASDIVDPLYRFIHKILAATLIGRGEGENKVNQLSLFCLMCMVEGRPANLATIFAQSMKRLWRGGAKARIYCGPYITWLAEYLGVFQTYPADKMRQGPAPCFMSLKDLQAAGIVTTNVPPTWAATREGPQVPPPAGTDAAAAMQSAVPPRYQVPTYRQEVPAPQYPLRQPVPDPFTPEAAYGHYQDRFDQLEHRMTVDQQWNMQSHHRQDDMLRYMMTGMHLDVPQPFSGLLPPPVYGGDQQTPYVYGQYPGYDQWGAQSGYGYGNQYGWQEGGGSHSQPMDEEEEQDD